MTTNTWHDSLMEDREYPNIVTNEGTFNNLYQGDFKPDERYMEYDNVTYWMPLPEPPKENIK